MTIPDKPLFPASRLDFLQSPLGASIHAFKPPIGQLPVADRLASFLEGWLGVWPPPNDHAIVVAEERDRPGWDGRIRPIQGVTTPEGNLLTISPGLRDHFSRIDPEQFFADLSTTDANARLSHALNAPVAVGEAVLRWAEVPLAVVEPERQIGYWLHPTDERLPAWLHMFAEPVLVAFEGDAVAAGVGIKHHTDTGYELAVGTEPRYRGKGLARALVAQAAQSILARGGVPIYRHEAHNVVSARVAEATGFFDHGWRTVDLALVDM